MSKGMQIAFLVVFALFVMQSIGGVIQIKDYRRAVRRIHKYGNVGIGQKRGHFFSSYLVLIACDGEGIITQAEILDGATILSKFHPLKKLLGRELAGASIYDYLEEFLMMDKKQKKRYKGYIQAMEALSMRLNPLEEPEETDEDGPTEISQEAGS
ncbi:MAG: transcriptional regulator [Lachnospiraceae bacterium]|nr:transcriptional regulator [Lachnospiraceae bacterium]